MRLVPQSTVKIASFAWIALVVAILVLCFWINAWPFSALAPWQMRQFGRIFPVSSLVLLAVVPIALGLVMLRLAGSRAAADAPAFADPVVAEVSPVRPIYQLFGAAELRYTVSRFGIASVERYLPLMGPAASAPGPVTLIVRRPDNGLTFDPAALPDRFAGVLVPNALPTGVEASFAAQGVPLASTYWVLVSDPASLYRPYWIAGGALLAIALALTGLGAWKLWRLRRGRP
jgi:hypothetical protein